MELEGKLLKGFSWENDSAATLFKLLRPGLLQQLTNLFYIWEKDFFFNRCLISPFGFLFVAQKVALWFDTIYSSFCANLINTPTPNCSFPSMFTETNFPAYL
jgi:hypothetical protein